VGMGVGVVGEGGGVGGVTSTGPPTTSSTAYGGGFGGGGGGESQSNTQGVGGGGGGGGGVGGVAGGGVDIEEGLAIGVAPMGLPHFQPSGMRVTDNRSLLLFDRSIYRSLLTFLFCIHIISVTTALTCMCPPPHMTYIQRYHSTYVWEPYPRCPLRDI
jgi:hypothetical protein